MRINAMPRVAGPTVAGLILALISAHCWPADISFTYPKSDKMTVYVSPDTVSLWTETPGNQRLIPDSQVFIAGRNSWLPGYAGGLVGGAIGGAVGAAIDGAANYQKDSAASSARSGLQVSFSKDLSTILKDKIASRSLGDRLSVVDASDNPQLTLLPSATVTVLDDRSAARLQFRLTVRFTDAITNSPVKKEYYYLHGESKPVAGSGSWTEDDAKAFKAIAAEALAKQTDVWLDDVLEGFAASSEPAKQRFITYTIIPGKQVRAVLLREYPEYIAVAPVIRGLRDRTAWGLVVILERRSVVMGD